MAKRRSPKKVETIRHKDASRKNIPTAEYQAVMADDEQSPIRVAYERRNRDLDPQLVWRGKDEQNWSDLVVQAPPLYIQEKVHPKVLIDDLIRQSGEDAASETGFQTDLFADFNGLPSEDAKTEFYQHDANWSNRMILGDSLQVMASLAEREGLRGKVQCIYIDPPYGIRFNSNFQWSTTSRDVKDGKAEHITREPEQVKAYRDTWRDGIHSYLTYLRDRLTVARDLLTESGSIFVQIGDENVHRVRALMDEVFGEENFVNQINCRTNSGTTRGDSLKRTNDYLIWYAKESDRKKFRRLVVEREVETRMYNQLMFDDHTIRSMNKIERKDPSILPEQARPFRKLPLHSMNAGDHTPRRAYGREWTIPSNRSWRHSATGFIRLLRSSRIQVDRTALSSRYYHSDYPVSELTETWTDTGPEINKSYVVQTSEAIIQRCILMTTDPGDLVLDPTCGSGTTAYIAEQWGRRWITIDTSRVALALARARIMGAYYPYYLLSDSREGRKKEIERRRHLDAPTYNDIRQGFVYERVPHITLRAIANNAEIDVIWENFQEKSEPLQKKLNSVLGTAWEEWEIPREAGDPWPEPAAKALQRLQQAKTSSTKARALTALNSALSRAYTLDDVPDKPFDPWTNAEAIECHRQWWKQRIARQKKIDGSIAAKADNEYLYDKPYEDRNKVRVAGPFTVDSLSPHRLLAVDENDDLIDNVAESKLGYGDKFDKSSNQDFATMVMEHIKTSGVQQAHKEDKITFSGIRPWPGDLVCAEGSYFEGDEDSEIQKRAGIFIGPEFGTVARPDLVQAAREAADADFDVLIACAFNYEAHASEFNKLGRIPVLKARMNADLHMADDLKNTGKGNLFVIFGEPDIDILDADDGQIKVKINGIDVFHPNTGEIRSDDTGDIACWFVDTDYNEESFFARHAYFLGANDPYKSLKTTLKSEINQEAWATLKSDTSRSFDKPKSGRIAVKVINHLGDEVMKVFRV